MQAWLPGLNLVFPRSYARGYEPSENIRRAEDCPPYQRSHFDKAKPLMESRMVPARICRIRTLKMRLPRRAPIRGAVNSASGGPGFVRASYPARFGLHKTPDDMEVIPPTEPKPVLEHRAPKTSPPILHSRNAESR